MEKEQLDALQRSNKQMTEVIVNQRHEIEQLNRENAELKKEIEHLKWEPDT